MENLGKILIIDDDPDFVDSVKYTQLTRYAEAFGMEIPPLCAQTQTRVEKLLPKPGSSGTNPIDVANPFVEPKVLKEILGDLEKNIPMNRLLQGDVGSGKTVVAGAAAFIAFANGYQSVFMAPTQILARQHFNTLNKLLQPFSCRAGSGSARKVRISLITSQDKKLEIGRSDIFVGTHALLHRKIKSI